MILIIDFILLVNLNGTSDKDAQNNITCLSQFLHLSNITEIVFGPTFDVSRWKDMQLILQYVELELISR